MKKIKSMLCLIISLGALTTFAQPTTTPVEVQNAPQIQPLDRGSLPVQSQDMLREYALAHVDHGSRTVYSASMDWNYQGITWTNAIGVGAEDVLGKLFNVEFRYRLTNPNDSINGYVYLYDKQNNLLFFGSATYTDADTKKAKPQYNIWMQSVPMLSGVSSAEVLALDTNGTTARIYSVDVDKDGQIMFQSWMAGCANGLLSVRFTDGTLLTYRLSNPYAETPGVDIEAVSYKIDGHYIVPPSLDGKGVSVNVLETWLLPTVYLEVKAKELATLNILGIIQDKLGNPAFERPTGFTYTQVDGPWAGAGNMLTDQPTKTMFPAAGKYRIRFTWSTFCTPGLLYTGPEYPSGGGVGAATVATP